MIYLTSDLHLGHTGLFDYWPRPFSCIEEHDEALIDAINAAVGKRDALYVLGDFTLRFNAEDVLGYASRIRCRNKVLVRGNHDKSRALPDAFDEVCDYRELKAGGRLACMSHYPMLDWNCCTKDYPPPAGKKGSVMLHGHIHSIGSGLNLSNVGKGIWRWDVGVDANGYRPVCLDEVLQLLEDRGDDAGAPPRTFAECMADDARVSPEERRRVAAEVGRIGR